MPEILLTSLAAIAGLHFLVWLLSLALKDVSIVDIFWGLGFVLIAWVSLLLAGDTSPTAWALVTLVTLWGLRLGGYLAWRNWGEPEDKRYRKMRDHHGARFPLVSLLTVFALQAALTWIIALPVQTGIAQGGPLGAAVVLGGLLWGVGMFFESVGDFQLARFKANPDNDGKVMNRGLWRYTRHPNYFGDFCVWWGLYLVSIGSGFVWWTLFGPVVMSILLLKVSGVTLLESSLKSRVEGYDDYVKSTSSFFPWPPQTIHE